MTTRLSPEGLVSRLRIAHYPSLALNEPDTALGLGFGRSGKFTDHFDDASDRHVVMRNAALQLVEFFRQFLVRRHHLPEAHERAHDVETYLRSRFAAKQIRSHQCAMLGKDPRQQTWVAVFLGTGHSL